MTRDGPSSGTRKELHMTPVRERARSANAKTASITPSQLRLLAQREHEEWLLDEALRETFPASDPIAVTLDEQPVVGQPSSAIDPPKKRI
jgi:hypothetical protein